MLNIYIIFPTYKIKEYDKNTFNVNALARFCASSSPYSISTCNADKMTEDSHLPEQQEYH